MATFSPTPLSIDNRAYNRVGMDGLLVVDKPSGPTSHDIVARVRRLLQEKRIGHTGTLDPMASGVLPLVVGRATRLARFMSSDEKRYDATIRFGFATNTRDAMGVAEGPVVHPPFPDRDAIDRALDAFRGTFAQQPPAFSAKKVGGERSYRLARRREHGATDTEPTVELPAAVDVTAHRIEITGADDDSVAIALTCSSGFYVRSLAHDLGVALGVGAHLTVLRRTATSGVTLADAVPLERLDDRAAAEAAVIPLERLVPHLPALRLTELGLRRAIQGQELGPADALGDFPAIGPAGACRLMDAAGSLHGIAEPSERPGLLHPAVILM